MPPDSQLKRDMPLVPANSIAGRALVVVIAIMTFLACLTAGGAILVAEASQAWRADVSRDVTIQIKPRPGDDVDSARRRGRRASRRARPASPTCTPTPRPNRKSCWRPGSARGSISGNCRSLASSSSTCKARHREDLEPLRAALAAGAPGASLDDHRLWLSRLDTMADAVVVFAAALFALMILAMGTAIGFATRGAMAGNREIIEVLHFVGAADSYIAAPVPGAFPAARLQGRGDRRRGGGGCSSPSRRSSRSWGGGSAGGEEIAALFGAFALGLPGYAAIARDLPGASPG